MKKILIIDDEEWLREMVNLALSQKGYEVIEAENGVVGIETAQRELPDLILCDINMEKVDGYLTLSSLRSQPTTMSIPLILITGLPDQAGMRHGMELGADDYLPKPFTIDALYAAVEARLKKTQALKQEAERRLNDLRDNISLMLPHELRTPLNGILAYGEILSNEASSLPPHEVAEMGKVILESGKRLERLVENFLIYAQIEIMAADPQKVAAAQTKRTTRTAAIIAERSQSIACDAKRMGDLVLELVDGPLPMSDDYLARVVDEIVRNAFKFSDSGTKVLITLAESSGSAVLSVTDHGRGFSTEQITRIGAYMQFNRNIQEQQGLGLGLTIAKRLTEVHGGVMQIQSSQGSRTTVTLKLPLNIPWSNTPSAARLSGASPAFSVAQYLEQLPG